MIDYRITLYNRDNQAILTLPSPQLHSFTYSKYLRSGGSVEIRMHDVEAFMSKLRLPESLDYKWVIQRRDSQFQSELEVDAIGLHRGVQYLQLESGNWLNYSYAVSLTDLLMTEATDLTNYSKSGVISDVAMEYARDLLVQFPSIGFADIKNPSTVIWEGDRRYKKLVTILNELADIDEAQFTINNDFEFEWFYPIDNGTVVHSDLGQIKGLQVVNNYIELATHSTVLGIGIDDDRLSHTEYLEDFYQKYGEYYFNHIVRTGSGKTVPALQDIAQSSLQERLQEVIDVQFYLTNHPTLLYGRDFDIGHILRVHFYGEVLKVIVHSIYITLNKEGIESVLVRCKYVYS